MEKRAGHIFKRIGVMLLSISIMCSMLLSMGLTEYSYAETENGSVSVNDTAKEEEKAAEAEADKAADAESSEKPDAESGEAAETRNEDTADQSKAASQKEDAEAAAKDEGKLLEFVDFSYEEPMELGVLQAGYSKADAKECGKYIVVRNAGSEAVNIDPDNLGVGNSSAFYYSGTGKASQLEPGKTAVLGLVQPRHQMSAGVYKTTVSFHGSKGGYIYGRAEFRVTSGSCEIQVVDDEEDIIDSLTLGSLIEGHVSDRAESLWLQNLSSVPVNYEISSDNRLFSAEFAESDPSGEACAEALDMTELIIKVNKRRAQDLEAGTYEGNIRIRAVTEDRSKTAEMKLPVSVDIIEEPCWELNEFTKSIPEWYSQYYYTYMSILNAEAFDEDEIDKYLRAELSEGSEYFYIDQGIDSDGYVKLSTQKQLEPGVYEAVLDLYYDREGKGGKGSHCDSCRISIEVIGDNDYNLEMDDDEIYLGVLPEGYSAKDAAELSKQIAVKNTGTKSLVLSPAGLKPEKTEEAQNFVFSSSSEESVNLKSGEVYDAVSVQPAENMKAGVYSIEAYFTDDENKAYAYFEITYVVGKEGAHLSLETSDFWSESKPVGPDGIDFGTFAPEQETSVQSIYVIGVNEGTVPLSVSASLENDNKGVFSINPAWNERKIKEGSYTGFTLKCDPSKYDSLGTYTADLKLTYADSSASGSGSQTLTVPVRLTKSKKQVYEVTLDFQGKGGYENVTVEAAKGSSYTDVVTDIMADVMNVKYGNVPWPTDDEYTMVAITKKKDGELKDWDDAKASTNEIRKGTVSEDTTIFINWAKKINLADLKAEIPECGADLSEAPEIKHAADDHYSVYKASWQGEEGEKSFTGGKDYTVEAVLTPEFGYAFASDADTMINGKHAASVSGSSDPEHFKMSGTLTAKHDLGDWYPAGTDEHEAKCSKCRQFVYEKHSWDEGEETLEPTCEEPGKFTYTCEVCGYKRNRMVPALEHDYKYTVTQKTSGTELGYMDCVCTACGDEFEDTFEYDCTEGSGAAYYRGSGKGLSFTFTRYNLWHEEFTPENCLTGIRIDDTEYPVDSSDREYGVSIYGEVETEISFYRSMADSFADGEHTITCLFEDGESNTVKFTVAEPKKIKEVEMNIGAPVCGDSASRMSSLRTGTVITNPPVITLAEDAPYEVSSVSKAFWTDENMDPYWSGTFKGGETAYAYVCLAPKEGSVFSLNDDYDRTFNGMVKVNGKEITPLKTASYSYLMRFFVPVEAVHVWDEGEVTKKPSAGAEGEMIFTCTKCGETKKVSISNDKEKEEARRAAALSEGAEHRIGGATYRITSGTGRTAAFLKENAGAGSVIVPESVQIEGETFTVTEIAADAFRGSGAKKVTLGPDVNVLRSGAFSGSKVKTLIVKSKKLTKAGVRGSLKGSKVKTVKVKVGSGKVNKKYVKKYKKIFTRKNAGRKVTVK